MIKLLILVGLFISIKAFAGYTCEFELSHTEELDRVIAHTTLVAGNSDMRSELVPELYVESEKKNRVQSIAMKLFVDGWEGEEEITLAMFRRNQKRSEVKLELISEKVSLRGNARDTLWFDSYKLDIECSLN